MLQRWFEYGAISNGSQTTCTVRTQDCVFEYSRIYISTQNVFPMPLMIFWESNKLFVKVVRYV